MSYSFKTKGICASLIKFDITDGKLYNVEFVGGCNGNLKAISKLVNGMECDKVISLLKGNTCGWKSTSCADQLTKAIELALNEQGTQE
ncbi:MAG: TIGR03905 family TSCPD domain-containing protein [Clostridia bacterium]|nr:TIGR03905 family TSCPD domain-containing protein [Clostridia bacterium]